jgi:hypothetical protein
MPSTVRALLVLLCAMTLTACATIHRTAMPDQCVPCAALEVVSFSASGDTEQTVREIREQNAVIRKLCD